MMMVMMVRRRRHDAGGTFGGAATAGASDDAPGPRRRRRILHFAPGVEVIDATVNVMMARDGARRSRDDRTRTRRRILVGRIGRRRPLVGIVVMMMMMVVVMMRMLVIVVVVVVIVQMIVTVVRTATVPKLLTSQRRVRLYVAENAMGRK